MIFKDLVDKVSIIEVCIKLLKIYPNQEKLIPNYISVFEKLRNMKPIISTECAVLLVSPTEDYLEENQCYDNVSLYNIKEKQFYALEFTPWEEWLGFKVPEKAVKFYGEEVYVAHCLYEMTFISFDEDDIEEEITSLKEISDAIEKGECKTYSAEEVYKELGMTPIKPFSEEEKINMKIKMEKVKKNNEDILRRFL